jgi:tRNA 2-thiouridine synthesizing protein A
MSDVIMHDARGMKCPLPTLSLTNIYLSSKPGQVIEVIADCVTFDKDIRTWCERHKKVLLWMRDEGKAKRCQIQI